MYCGKCGTQNDDNNCFCSKCGANLKGIHTSNKSADGKSKLFAGLLLNIFAVAIPVILVLVMNSLSIYESKPDDGGISIDTTGDYSSGIMLVAMGVGIMIFILGIIIYFLRNSRCKSILSVVYLTVSIVDLVLFVAGTMLYVLGSCGLGLIMYVPGALQIIAGTKFISGSREYSNAR